MHSKMWLSRFWIFLLFGLVAAEHGDLEEVKTSEEVDRGSNSDNVTNYNDLASILDFYNTKDLVRNLKFFSGNLSKLCEDDMKLYVKGLNNNEEWALKSEYIFHKHQYLLF